VQYSIIGNHRNHQIGHIGIGYSIVGMIVLWGLDYLIVRMVVLDLMIVNHRITWIGIENSISRMIGSGGSELNIQ
jgi:hypothetical protein